MVNAPIRGALTTTAAKGNRLIIARPIDRLTIRLEQLVATLLIVTLLHVLLFFWGSDGRPTVLLQVLTFLRPRRPLPYGAQALKAAETSLFDLLNYEPPVMF